MREETFTIGKVARLGGVGVETVRFYEREGLIPEPPRRASGYRQYSPAMIDRIRFIRKAKALGFTLGEIKELLNLSVAPKMTCANVKRKALEKIKEVDAKIDHLKQIKKSLNRLMKQCRDNEPVSECPILENLESGRRKS